MWIFLWFLVSIGVGILASNKGRSGFGFFVLSLIISPIIAGLIVLCLDDDNKKVCPSCAEAVKREALKCKHCQHDFRKPLSGGDSDSGKSDVHSIA